MASINLAILNETDITNKALKKHDNANDGKFSIDKE